MVQISNNPYSTNYFYEGKYSENNIQYQFSLCIMILSNPEDTDYDVTFVDKIPEDEERARLEIIKFFNERRDQEG